MLYYFDKNTYCFLGINLNNLTPDDAIIVPADVPIPSPDQTLKIDPETLTIYTVPADECASQEPAHESNFSPITITTDYLLLTLSSDFVTKTRGSFAIPLDKIVHSDLQDVQIDEQQRTITLPPGKYKLNAMITVQLYSTFGLVSQIASILADGIPLAKNTISTYVLKEASHHLGPTLLETDTTKRISLVLEKGVYYRVLNTVYVKSGVERTFLYIQRLY